MSDDGFNAMVLAMMVGMITTMGVTVWVVSRALAMVVSFLTCVMVVAS